MFKHKINNVSFTVVQASVKNEKSDILFNWTISDLSSGDENFIEIHREGGSTIYKECQGALARFGKVLLDGTKAIPVGEAVLTDAGILSYKKLVHCVVPNYRNKEEKENKNNLFLSSVNYSLALINDYSKNHAIVRKIALTPVPERICGEFNTKLVKQFVKLLISNSESYGFKEVKIICKTEEEYNLYKSIFTSEFISFWDKIYYKFFA